MAECRRAGLLDVPGVDEAAMLGARDRHVEQPHFLRQRFQPMLRHRFGSRAALAAQVEREPSLGVVELHAVAPGRVRRRPEKRAKHDIVFQPLALMNRHDLNRIAVAFQPELGRIGRGALRRPLLAKPLDKRLGSEPLRGLGLVEQFGEM